MNALNADLRGDVLRTIHEGQAKRWQLKEK